MKGVNPVVTPGAYGRAELGGTLTPGIIPRDGIDGFDIDTDWEVKKGKGSDGATMTDAGDPPKKGKILFQLWRAGLNPGEPDDFADWDAFRDMLRAARKAGSALDLLHPAVNDHETKSVVVARIIRPRETRAGMWLAGVELNEWVPAPKPAGGTPGGSAANKGGAGGDNATPGGGTPPGAGAPSDDQQTEAEKELDALATEAGF